MQRQSLRGPLAPGYSCFAFCVVFVFCAASTAWADPFFTSGSTFASPHPAVVRVVAPERDGVSYGSGSLVAVDQTSGLVLTNWHVVNSATEPVVVYFPDGFRSRAYVLRVDRDWDLAALAIRRPNVQPIPLANQTPQFGDSLTIIGYGSGSYRAATGRCTQYVSPGGNLPSEMVELSAPARQGDSGGPILNGRGELAGVLFGTGFGRTTGSYCGRVREFLATVDGDFRKLSNRVMLADQARGAGAPAAAIPAGVMAASSWPPPEAAIATDKAMVDNRTSSAPPSTVATTTAAAPLSPLPSRSTLPAPAATASTDVAAGVNRPADAACACSVSNTAAAAPAGPVSTSEQVKTILALVGVVAVLYHALRLLGTAVG
jgi:hypothetical protein